MSQPSEISRPAVRQSPCTSARVAIGSCASLCTTGISEPKASDAAPSSTTRWKLCTSTPPVKMSPSARQTSALAWEPSTSSRHETSEPQASSPNRLSGGSESTITATLPSRSSRIGAVLVSAILTSQFGGYSRDLIGVSGGGYPGQLQGIIRIAGHDVDVEVEHRLPGGRSAGVDQVDPIRTERLPHPRRQPLRREGGRGQVVQPDLHQVRGVHPRHHQGMTAGGGI